MNRLISFSASGRSCLETFARFATPLVYTMVRALGIERRHNSLMDDFWRFLTVKTRAAIVLSASVGLLLSALPAVAHHSFAAEFDATKSISVSGTVTKMDWVNPHSHLMFDVKAEDGTIQHWAAECLPPNGLYRQGWRKDSVKAGDEVTVTGFKAKDGTFYMWASTVKTADGRRLFSGSPEGPAPQPQTSTEGPAPSKQP